MCSVIFGGENRFYGAYVSFGIVGRVADCVSVERIEIGDATPKKSSPFARVSTDFV